MVGHGDQSTSLTPVVTIPNGPFFNSIQGVLGDLYENERNRGEPKEPGSRVPGVTFPSTGPRLVLHAVRLKGFAEPAVVAQATGLDPVVVDEQLRRLADEGLVYRRDGRVAGWALTTAGREAHRQLAADELAAAGGADDVDSAYRRFLALNGPFLAVATAWQVRDDAVAPVANDHTDADYDAGVVTRLAAIHDEIGPVLADLAGCLARFGGYAPRLGHALDRVRAGEPEWFARPLIDSYHSIWFELHEDLLATLGRQRAAEHAQPEVPAG
jgi:hypothetical protein